MSLLNKLEKKLNDLYSQKWFLLTVLVLAIVFVIFGYFLDRGFKIKESSTKLAPTVVVEQKKNCLPTNQDVEGPYFRPNAPMRTSIAPQDAKGERLVMSGILYSSDCKTPITKFPTDAPLIEVWQADSEGKYDNTSSNYWYRGAIPVDSKGYYQFETIRPGNYLDGSGYRPAHIHFKVTVPGYHPLTTQLYFKDDPYLGPNDSCGPCNSEDPTLVVDLHYLSREAGAGIWTGIFNIVLESLKPQTLDTSTNSTAGWQTYRNSEFELKYPAQ